LLTADGGGGFVFIFIRRGRGGNWLLTLPARCGLMTDNRIYQSIESPKEQGETGIFKLVAGRTADPLSVEMSEVSGVAGQQIVWRRITSLFS